MNMLEKLTLYARKLSFGRGAHGEPWRLIAGLTAPNMNMLDLLTLYSRRLSFGRRVRAETWRLMADLTAAKMDIGDAFKTAATVYRQRGQGQVETILLDMRAAIPRNELIAVATSYASDTESFLLASLGKADAHKVFDGMARIARADLVIQQAIMAAIAMPIVNMMVLCGVFYLAGSQLFPSLLDLLPMEQWPGVSWWFGAFTMWFARNGYILAMIGFILFIGLRFAIPNWIGPGRKYADRFPPFSFYKLRAGASFLFAVVEAGRMRQEIHSDFFFSMAQRGSPYIKSRVSAIAHNVSVMSLGEATIASNHEFPARDLNTILNAFSGQPNWLESMSKFTDRWLEDVETRAKRTAALLNVVLLAIVAGAIGLLITSIFQISQTLTL